MNNNNNNNNNNFKNLGIKHRTDKVDHHGYNFFYPKHLESFRDDEFNMLEIGYQGGHSCRMWEEYFPKANIFAMDINTEGKFNNHIVFRGDQSNRNDLDRISNEIVSAKFIIDDGSHHPIHQIETFNFLFKKLLEPGGVYIIEDIECNYWNEESSIYGYRIGFFNAVDYTKKLIDYVNSEFSKKENKLKISSITYAQNCIIITKQTEEEENHFNRNYRFSQHLKS
jgi:hypothetical protein